MDSNAIKEIIRAMSWAGIFFFLVSTFSNSKAIPERIKLKAVVGAILFDMFPLNPSGIGVLKKMVSIEIFNSETLEIIRNKPVNMIIQANTLPHNIFFGTGGFVARSKKETPEKINAMAVAGFIAKNTGIGRFRKLIVICQPINAIVAIIITM